MRRKTVVLGMVASSFATSASAAAVTPLEPTSAWRMDYSNERCSLAQQYGSSGDALLLQIDSFGSVERFRVTLAGPGVPRGSTQTRAGSYRLPGDDGGREAKIVQGVAGADPAVTFDMQFTPYREYKRVRQLNGQERIEESRREATFPDFARTIGAIAMSL